MSDRFKYGMPAVEAVRQLNGLDDDVVAARGAATSAVVSAAASASLSASNAASAAQARDAAIQAWQASTAPAERLAAMSQAFHKGVIVDAFLYDTSRDSDGGAWRQRCSATSWETEALAPGKWLGTQAGTLAALAAGGVIGDFYYYGGDNTFRVLAGTIGSERSDLIYRGSGREFPGVALIVLEAARLVIYDATRPELPMWMVFEGKRGGGVLYGSASVLTSVVAMNGLMVVGAGDASTGYLSQTNFVADRAFFQVATNVQYNAINVANRNNSTGPNITGTTTAIVNRFVYDLAIITLPEAPIDPSTGLAVPTLAVGTAGGVSVIKHDGNVVNDTAIGGATAMSSFVGFTLDGRLMRSFGSDYRRLGIFTGGGLRIPAVSASLNSNWDIFGDPPTAVGSPFTPSLTVRSVEATRDYIAAAYNGLSLLKHNPSARVSSMLAYLTNAYTTGWMVGDVRGAWLADVTAETLSGGELVVNGDFTANTNNWTASGTLSISNGRLRLTTTVAGQAGFAEQYVPTIPGRMYGVKCDFFPGTSAVYLTVGQSSPYIMSITQDLSSRTLYFVAVSNQTRLLLRNNSSVVGEYGEFDNVSVKLAVADRGVKANGMILGGTLTKAPVAPGAQLMAYSGFSANNYLEQPYNPDMDFGVEDFCIMGWVNPTGPRNSNYVTKANTTYDSTNMLVLLRDGNGLLRFYMGPTAYITGGALPAGVFAFFVALRRGNVIELWINGVLAATGTSNMNVSSTDHVIRIGAATNGILAADAQIALVRIGATAPSADQIAQIYRDELPLFQPGAQCTLDGTTSTVTALSFDPVANLLHAGTAWGRSTFRGLQRIESDATIVGGITSLSAFGGAHIIGGAGGARYSQPAVLLRDELRRRDETRRAQGAVPVPFWREGGAASYALPVGFEVYAVYRQGLIAREGAGNDYTTSFDGYRWMVVFTARPSANSNICIMGVRNGAN